jgi:hypothetical protein
MTKREITKLVKQFRGWMDGPVARFPSTYLREQFEAAYDATPLTAGKKGTPAA